MSLSRDSGRQWVDEKGDREHSYGMLNPVD